MDFGNNVLYMQNDTMRNWEEVYMHEALEQEGNPDVDDHQV